MRQVVNVSKRGRGRAHKQCFFVSDIYHKIDHSLNINIVTTIWDVKNMKSYVIRPKPILELTIITFQSVGVMKRDFFSKFHKCNAF